MNKVSFQSKMIFSTILSTRWMSAVTLVVMVLCYIMPVLHLSWIENNKIIYSSRKNVNECVDYSFKFNPKEFLSEEDIKTLPYIKNFNLEAMIIRTMASLNERSLLINLIGIKSYLTEGDFALVKGSMPTKKQIEDREKVCLVTLPFFNKEKLSIGDEISVFGQKVKIIGVVIKPYSVPTVLVDFDLFETLAQGQKYQYTLDFTVTQPVDKADLASALFSSMNLEGPRLSSKAELSERGKAAYNFNITGLAKTTLYILALSIFSIILVVGGYFYNKRQIYAVKLVSGAKHRDIFTEIFIELFIYSFASIMASLAIISIFEHLFTWIANTYININLLIVCVGLALISSFIMALVIWLFIIRRNLVLLLRS